MQVTSQTAYAARLMLLNEYRDIVFNEESHLVGAPDDMAGILGLAKELGHVVSLLDAEGYGPSGFVREIAADFVELQRLNSKGMPDGIAVLRLDAIDRITVNTRDEQVLAFLYRYHFEWERKLES